MELTQRQLLILNHVVIDGQAWADNAKKEAHIIAKVARWEADYDKAVAKGDYKNRATRDEDERVANLPTPMDTWKRAMTRTDRMMPRYLEDLITNNSELVIPEKMKTRYDEKIALRVTKP